MEPIEISPAKSAWSFQKIYRYQKERFPIFAYTLLVLLTLASSGIDHLSDADFKTLIPAFFLFMLFFLRLRLFDEIKDYELDKKFRPERIVARGEVTLNNIRHWLIVCIVFEILLLTMLPYHFSAWYVIASVWSVFMFYEFFVPVWLTKRFLLYGFVHIIVMFPLALAMRASFTVNVWNDVKAVWIAIGIAGISYIFELGRKIWSTTEERPGVDTYSGHIGIKASTWLLTGFIIVVHSSFTLAYPYLLSFIVLSGILALLFFPYYILTQNSKLKANLERISGVYILLFYLGLLVSHFVVSL